MRVAYVSATKNIWIMTSKKVECKAGVTVSFLIIIIYFGLWGIDQAYMTLTVHVCAYDMVLVGVWL